MADHWYKIFLSQSHFMDHASRLKMVGYLLSESSLKRPAKGIKCKKTQKKKNSLKRPSKRIKCNKTQNKKKILITFMISVILTLTKTLSSCQVITKSIRTFLHRRLECGTWHLFKLASICICITDDDWLTSILANFINAEFSNRVAEMKTLQTFINICMSKILNDMGHKTWLKLQDNHLQTIAQK